MTRRVTILAAALAASAATAPAAPFPHYAYQQAKLFAVCSGRMSAMFYRQQADRSPKAPETERLMQTFDSLLEAVADAAYAEGVPKEEPSRWKSNGWTEIQYLMHEAAYGFSATASDGAKAKLATSLKECRDLVLPT